MIIKKSASLMRRFILKQYMVRYIGAVQTTLGVAFFYLSPISFVMLAVTTYKVAIGPWAAIHAPWLTLWVFLGMLPAFLVLGLVLVFKFVLASVYGFGNVQGYTHGSPFAADLQDIIARLKRIEGKTKEIKVE